MALDEPSAQLHLDIRHDVESALSTRRPILHHLNADTTWFLQIPRPKSVVEDRERFYYNILIDPWLSGGQSDVASWFSQQFHATKSAVQSIAEVEELAREVEILATGLRLGAGRKTNAENGAQLETFIDAVAVSHEFTDHCHKDTLLEIHPSVPVFAIKEAAKLIEGWRHFQTIITLDTFGADGNRDWKRTSVPPLPEWIGISRLLQKEDVLNYHAALMITFNLNERPASKRPKSSSSRKHRETPSLDSSANDEAAEAVIYTPHGMYSGDLNLITDAEPPIQTLAFLHGLHNVRVGTASGRTALQSNLGAHNGLKAQRLLHAKYWIGTHDEIKTGGGLVSWFLQREVISVNDALDAERRTRELGKGIADEELVDAFEGTNWIDLRNGESRVLV